MPELYFPFPWLTLAAFMALSALSTLLFCWVLYYVVKCAIRDGLRESGLVQTVGRKRQGPEPNRSYEPLPDFRAD